MTSGAVYAAQGKLEGLGPLKLGISEQEVYRTPGQSSRQRMPLSIYEQKLKILNVIFDLTVVLKDAHVSSYRMRDQFTAGRAAFCSRFASRVKAVLARQYLGAPDFTLPTGTLGVYLGATNEESTASWFFDDGRIDLETASFGDKCMAVIQVWRLDPDDLKLTVLPQR
jgi:hypothetical protein